MCKVSGHNNGLIETQVHLRWSSISCTSAFKTRKLHSCSGNSFSQQQRPKENEIVLFV